MEVHKKDAEAFVRLLNIMDELRAQCPWDKKQTMESLRHLTIEEVYELGDAILEKEMQDVRKELGDLMLHLVFYAKIASEANCFDAEDVINGVCDKLIFRHPHIYGDIGVKDADEVKRNWEQIKLKEKQQDGKQNGVLKGVPVGLPALVKATRIQDKARGAGFDWEESHQVWDKVREEMEEFHQEASGSGDPEQMEAEFGDLLFSLVNYARFININPEDALERTNKKFIKRFNYLESKAATMGKRLAEMTLDEMNLLWEEAKKLS